MTYRLVGVGASGHLNYVLGELPRYPQVQLAAYAPSFEGEDVSRYARVSAAATEPRAYDDWRRMLDAEEPDIVVVCPRYDLTATVALEAVRRGCHVISEKPAALDLGELDELRRAVNDAGVLYTMMLAIRYQPPYYTARQLVSDGVIGEPYLLSGQKSYRWGPERPDWYADPAKYGSTMAWVGIHAFDFARWIARVDYTEVFAYHANLVRTERPGCQDVATVIARLNNGGSAVFNLDYLRPDASLTHGDDRVRVAGSRGVLEVCDAGTRLHVITAEKDEPEWPLIDHGRTFFGDFMGALEGRGELLITAGEAFRVTEFALKAAVAADEHRIVPV